MTGSSELVTVNAGELTLKSDALPRIIKAAGRRASERWFEFFTAELTNDNTRRAYAIALSEFFAFLEHKTGLASGPIGMQSITSVHIALWRESLIKQPMLENGKPRAVTTVKLKLAAVRSFFRYLQAGSVLLVDPAAAVRAPKHSVTIGKTPVLEGGEAAKILDHLSMLIASDPKDLIALRDRALIAMLVFTLARISAAVGMRTENVRRVSRRLEVQLVEKGGKVHVMPCHHELEDYLMAYIEAASLETEPLSPLFRSVDNATGTLGDMPLKRTKAWEMVQRRVRAAAVTTVACNHTFRATGITTFLLNGGAIEKARDMAAHASIRTTQLYDRRSKAVKQDDVVLINLRAGSTDDA